MKQLNGTYIHLMRPIYPQVQKVVREKAENGPKAHGPVDLAAVVAGRMAEQAQRAGV